MEYQRLDDLLKRATPYLPVAVDMELRTEIMALRQQARKAVELRAEVEALRALLATIRNNPHIQEILLWDANIETLARITALLERTP